MDAGGAEGVEYLPITLWVIQQERATSLLAKGFQRGTAFLFVWGVQRG